MDESDVLMHFRFNTEVARWLQTGFGEKSNCAYSPLPSPSWGALRVFDMSDLVCVSTHSCQCSTCELLIEAPPTLTEQDAMRDVVREFELYVQQSMSSVGVNAQGKQNPTPPM